MKSTLIDISGLRLENALLKQGVTLRQASNELGYSDWFLSNCKSRNKINKAATIGIESRYGIRLDDYKDEPEEVKEEEPQEVHADPIDYERLWKIFYTASKKAVEEALRGE